jgi:hypothetical protein
MAKLTASGLTEYHWVSEPVFGLSSKLALLCPPHPHVTMVNAVRKTERHSAGMTAIFAGLFIIIKYMFHTPLCLLKRIFFAAAKSQYSAKQI